MVYAGAARERRETSPDPALSLALPDLALTQDYAHNMCTQCTLRSMHAQENARNMHKMHKIAGCEPKLQGSFKFLQQEPKDTRSMARAYAHTNTYTHAHAHTHHTVTHVALVLAAVAEVGDGALPQGEEWSHLHTQRSAHV
eukprot:1158442-Pelagomonas_calceolata.AAC.3